VSGKSLEKRRRATLSRKRNVPSDLPVYPEVPYAFFGFQLAPSTYSTFGILRFTVLSRLGQAKVSSRLESAVNGQKSVRRQATFRGLTI
jgi:hypothetical protein